MGSFPTPHTTDFGSLITHKKPILASFQSNMTHLCMWHEPQTLSTLAFFIMLSELDLANHESKRHRMLFFGWRRLVFDAHPSQSEHGAVETR